MLRPGSRWTWFCLRHQKSVIGATETIVRDNVVTGITIPDGADPTTTFATGIVVDDLTPPFLFVAASGNEVKRNAATGNTFVIFIGGTGPDNVCDAAFPDGVCIPP